MLDAPATSDLFTSHASPATRFLKGPDCQSLAGCLISKGMFRMCKVCLGLFWVGLVFFGSFLGTPLDMLIDGV